MFVCLRRARCAFQKNTSVAWPEGGVYSDDDDVDDAEDEGAPDCRRILNLQPTFKEVRFRFLQPCWTWTSLNSAFFFGAPPLLHAAVFLCLSNVRPKLH